MMKLMGFGGFETTKVSHHSSPAFPIFNSFLSDLLLVELPVLDFYFYFHDQNNDFRLVLFCLGGFNRPLSPKR
ncbi:hypothetical protein BKA69DRAFT_1046410 [Paraphysoderma sedebokerense]|nr:hypothetical protein BKA69DRAFT_1046410 [Paraphysoderma sedebokerense]